MLECNGAVVGDGRLFTSATNSADFDLIPSASGKDFTARHF